MSDPRLAVLLDLLREIGEGEPAAGLERVLRERPELWLGVPRDALVALPWECPRGSSLRAFRPAAGAATTLFGAGTGLRGLRAAKVGSSGDGLVIEIVEVEGRERPRVGYVSGWTPRAPREATLEEAQAAADAALLAAGWRLL